MFLLYFDDVCFDNVYFDNVCFAGSISAKKIATLKIYNSAVSLILFFFSPIAHFYIAFKATI